MTELGELEVVVEVVLKKEREVMSGQERRARLVKKGQEAEKWKKKGYSVSVSKPD